MQTLSLEINNQSSILFNPDAAAIALFEAIHASARFPISEGELSIVFVNDAEIAQVHADFMDDPSPTDVITFDHGEVLISADTARRQAAEYGQHMEREIALYIVHGLLHLAGHEDRGEAQVEAMRELQERLLTNAW